ncbi:hypothetical protein [Agrobacterium tumefaciens]|uniref:hypothetical protein n=1 Tax=Agrobacterium tumefaciens TaxID=358 RepID=UPI001B89EA90
MVVLAAGISPAKPALPRNPTDGLSKLEGVVAKNTGRGPLAVPAISAIQDDPGSKNCIAPLAKRAGGIALVPAVVSFHAVLNPAVHQDERQGKPWPSRLPRRPARKLPRLDAETRGVAQRGSRQALSVPDEKGLMDHSHHDFPSTDQATPNANSIEQV